MFVEPLAVTVNSHSHAHSHTQGRVSGKVSCLVLTFLVASQPSGHCTGCWSPGSAFLSTADFTKITERWGGQEVRLRRES